MQRHARPFLPGRLCDGRGSRCGRCGEGHRPVHVPGSQYNISDDVVSCNGQITLREADRFWLAEQWNDPHREELVKHNPYVRFMAKHIEGISVGRIAVMDLNKRGGFGTCNHTRLRHYVEAYEPFIRREIDIISPNIIICGGTFGTVKELLPNGLENRVKVWDCHHPRSWRDQDAGQIKKWVFEGICRET